MLSILVTTAKKKGDTAPFKKIIPRIYLLEKVFYIYIHIYILHYHSSYCKSVLSYGTLTWEEKINQLFLWCSYSRIQDYEVGNRMQKCQSYFCIYLPFFYALLVFRGIVWCDNKEMNNKVYVTKLCFLSTTWMTQMEHVLCPLYFKNLGTCCCLSCSYAVKSHSHWKFSMHENKWFLSPLMIV